MVLQLDKVVNVEKPCCNGLGIVGIGVPRLTNAICRRNSTYPVVYVQVIYTKRTDGLSSRAPSKNIETQNVAQPHRPAVNKDTYEATGLYDLRGDARLIAARKTGGVD
jgi:hypothetical protein